MINIAWNNCVISYFKLFLQSNNQKVRTNSLEPSVLAITVFAAMMKFGVLSGSLFNLLKLEIIIFKLNNNRINYGLAILFVPKPFFRFGIGHVFWDCQFFIGFQFAAHFENINRYKGNIFILKRAFFRSCFMFAEALFADRWTRMSSLCPFSDMAMTFRKIGRASCRERVLQVV